MSTHRDRFLRFCHALHALRREDRGASLVEYALLVALIAIVCISAVALLGTNASSTFDSTATSLG
jgi:pilus assembly protein Flp/PilA